jgi:hypothetical protein
MNMDLQLRSEIIKGGDGKGDIQYKYHYCHTGIEPKVKDEG